MNSPCLELHKSPFIFDRTKEAAEHNSSLILQYNGDVQTLMQSLELSFTHYGSEFRSIHLLETLLSTHSKWPKLKSIITNGTNYPMEPISEEDRIVDHTHD